MNIELSNHEVELLDKALQAWEHEPVNTGVTSTLIEGLFSIRDRSASEMRERSEASLRKATDTARERRTTSVLLRAKLYQALARESEQTG